MLNLINVIENEVPSEIVKERAYPSLLLKSESGTLSSLTLVLF